MSEPGLLFFYAIEEEDDDGEELAEEFAELARLLAECSPETEAMLERLAPLFDSAEIGPTPEQQRIEEAYGLLAVEPDPPLPPAASKAPRAARGRPTSSLDAQLITCQVRALSTLDQRRATPRWRARSVRHGEQRGVASRKRS